VVRRIAGAHTKVFAALKANAYGFGITKVAKVVLSSGADAISLVDVQTAVKLRRRRIDAPILLYGGVPMSKDVAMAVCRYNLIPTILDSSAAETLSRAATNPLRVFVKIDVGLERLGIAPEEAVSFIKHLRALPNLIVHGVYSHLHVPDGSDAYLDWQFARFRIVIDALKEQSIEIPVKMVASTAVLYALPNAMLDAVDPGHMLFGLRTDGPARLNVKLRSAFRSLKSCLLQVKSLHRMEFRDCAPFRLTDEMRIGIFPMGLVDGIQSLTCGQVLVRGKRVPILGKPTLEHTRLDLTNVPEARVGDEVVVIGSQHLEEIRPDKVLEHQRMAPVELALAVRESIRRVYTTQGQRGLPDTDCRRGRLPARRGRCP
jgi:alanine racemase